MSSPRRHRIGGVTESRGIEGWGREGFGDLEDKNPTLDLRRQDPILSAGVPSPPLSWPSGLRKAMDLRTEPKISCILLFLFFSFFSCSLCLFLSFSVLDAGGEVGLEFNFELRRVAEEERAVFKRGAVIMYTSWVCEAVIRREMGMRASDAGHPGRAFVKKPASERFVWRNYSPEFPSGRLFARVYMRKTSDLNAHIYLRWFIHGKKAMKMKSFSPSIFLCT